MQPPTHQVMIYRALRRAALAVAVAAALIAGPAGLASAAAGAPGRASAPGLAHGTRFYVPPPSPGEPLQVAQLVRAHDLRDAALLTRMETFPRAVWFDGGTPAQVRREVRQTMLRAAAQHAVPVLVAYDVPGRDCAQYSAGGALSQADYQAWIDAFAAGVGRARAVVILEPDSLGLLPSDCGGPSAGYPFTDAERYAEIRYAAGSLAADQGARVYLDGTHSAWQSVGAMTQRLLAAGVRGTEGFYVNVSNYQPTASLVDYGTWISDCIAIVTDPSSAYYDHPDWCASQYYPATVTDYSTWGLTTAWYAANMGQSVATTRFVIDTSRNGTGPNSMQEYAKPPYNQPPAVIAALASGNWCNSPGAGLGLRPTAGTGVPLLDAYLWVKTPGQSDGQCDAAGGARAWDYDAYTEPGWPADAAARALFDPLWGMVDPAAGAWFPQQALELARNASPALR